MFNILIMGALLYFVYKNHIKTGKLKLFVRNFLPRVIKGLQRLSDGLEGRKGTRGASMTREEALQILGINHQASKDEIIQIFKKLMLKVHPDQGGNAYLANKIIQARKTLLNE